MIAHQNSFFFLQNRGLISLCANRVSCSKYCQEISKIQSVINASCPSVAVKYVSAKRVYLPCVCMYIILSFIIKYAVLNGQSSRLKVRATLHCCKYAHSVPSLAACHKFCFLFHILYFPKIIIFTVLKISSVFWTCS